MGKEGGFEPITALCGPALGLVLCWWSKPTSPYAGLHTSLLSPFTVCAGQPLITAHQRWFVLCRTQECGDLEMAGDYFFSSVSSKNYVGCSS